jgi:hypothetical protein
LTGLLPKPTGAIVNGPNALAKSEPDFRLAVESLYFQIMYQEVPRPVPSHWPACGFDKHADSPPKPDAIRFIGDKHKIYPTLCNTPLNAYGDTALHLAITYGRHELMDYLLTLDTIDVNIKNIKGVSPLLKAARLNNEELLIKLIERGADVMAQGNELANAIHEAAFGATDKASEIICALFNLGVDANAFCLDGSTALTTARLRNCPEKAIRFLSILHIVARTKGHPKVKLPTYPPNDAT